MGQLIIRDAKRTDMTTVRRIYAHHVLHGLGTFEEKVPSKAELERRRRQVRARGLPYLVAEIDGRIVGYSYATSYRERSAYRYTVEDSVYVDAEASRQGVGRALLREVIARAQAGGWRQMIAVIGDRGNHASIGLHNSFGFRLAGTLHAVGFKFGRWVDTVLMQRQLSLPARAPREAGLPIRSGPGKRR
jgi:L-amino acid N-acyltransferase YncA